MVGSRPKVEGEFRNDEEVLEDPTSITVITRDPSGDQVTYTTPHATIVNLSVGIWEFQFPNPITEAGTWWVYMRGNSGVQAANEIKLKIRGSNVAV